MLERVEADVWYLENWSFVLDIKIIFLTLWNSIRGDKHAF
jgi:putative colanic acid biosynthesis UDP-glucose lipid carrier transferase